jgi:ATP-dependent Lhr-like helicase
VSAFDNLHPALQHHIVNSLGWRELRPLQESGIGPILEGRHSLLLAPTAGGKTEAAFFPGLSRLLKENWTGLSVLYVCPLKALLNNLHERLHQYCQWVGRTCALWHGDISQATRIKMLKDAPDVLLTTPESLEVMLISSRVDKRTFFGSLRIVIVDCLGDRELITIPPASSVRQEVQIDYVGSLENAATIISRLYIGEKRLVFCDSRSRVEQLASHLRQLGVETFVSHSSLSVDERRRAELAFSQSSNCVIVATSTLELGVDVGDLDRVIQIDAPGSVASFLQRFGRSGRRSGALRNCLFLTTDRESLMQSIAIVEQWQNGYVEPVQPPVSPFHLLAQQILALALQEKGIGRQAWQEWLLRLPAFARMSKEDQEAIVTHMLDSGYLQEDEGILWLGREGEEEFGFRNFMELFAVFTSPPEFAVYCGRQHLGSVHESTFIMRDEGPVRLSLAGRAWRVQEINWSDRTAYVIPDEERGISRWLGLGRSIPFRLCRQIRTVLTDTETYGYLSQRAVGRLSEAREEFCWLKPDAICVRWPGAKDCTEVWTYAGQNVNASLSNGLQRYVGKTCTADNFRLRLTGVIAADLVQDCLTSMKRYGPVPPKIASVEALVEKLKFSKCLPQLLAQAVITARSFEMEHALAVAEELVVEVVS